VNACTAPKLLSTVANAAGESQPLLRLSAPARRFLATNAWVSNSPARRRQHCRTSADQNLLPASPRPDP